MNYWTRRRWASLIVHTIVVIIPLAFATISALFFWHGLFRDWLIAASIVTCIDVLAVLGLVLFITRIDSPFQVLRHALPFVSVVPLGLELHSLLSAHNTWWMSALIALLTTAIMTIIAWRCYVTIERLFVDPITAAREQMAESVKSAHEQMTANMTALTTTLASISEMNRVIAGATRTWQQQHVIDAPPLIASPVSRAAVKRFADASGVSERTIWRHLEQGKLKADEINDEEPS